MAGAADVTAAAADGAGTVSADGFFAAGVVASGRRSGPFCPQAPSTRDSGRARNNATARVVADGAPRAGGPLSTLGARRVASIPKILLAMTSATASPTPGPIASAALSDAEYRQRTASVLASIEATVDRWLQEDVIDIDSHRTGGLLELSFPNRSKIVINTQPPLHELWLASVAGGFHYRWNGAGWSDTRDGSDFFDALSREASAQGGQALHFHL